MLISLLSKTPEALKIAFHAIRTCYSPYDAVQIMTDDWNKYVQNNNDHIRLVKQIVNHGHTSTLEHISFTFAIEGISRALLAQLTRHRVGFSYSVQSQRYVKLSSDSKHGDFDYITPPSVASDESAKYTFELGMKAAQETYNVLVKLGVPAEDARYVLPNATETRLTLTVNLRAFMDFYSKRNEGTHAQWEIAKLAEMMKDAIIDTEPWTEMLFEKGPTHG